MLSPSFGWPDPELLTRLVRESRSGNASARNQLLETLRPALLEYFRRRESLDAAEDLTQRALIRVSGAIDRIDAERADSYISTVARNLLRTAYRASVRERGRAGDVEPAELPSLRVDIEGRLEYAELVAAIHRACLTKLGPGLREVAAGVMRGESAAEIAATLQVSPITVRTRLMRARAVLRAELAPYLEERR